MDPQLLKLRNLLVGANALKTSSRAEGLSDVTNWVAERRYKPDDTGIPASLFVSNPLKWELLIKDLALNDALIARVTKAELIMFTRFPEEMTLYKAVSYVYEKGNYPMDEEEIRFDTPSHHMHVFIDLYDYAVTTDALEKQWFEDMVTMLAYNCSVYLKIGSREKAADTTSARRAKDDIHGRWGWIE